MSTVFHDEGFVVKGSLSESTTAGINVVSEVSKRSRLGSSGRLERNVNSRMKHYSLIRLRLFLGVALLAFFAAWVNVLFLAEFGMGVSHMTGDVSKLFMDLPLHSDKIGLICELASIALSFMLGAGISGMFIGRGVLRFGMPYGIAVIGQSALLLSTFFLRRYSPLLCCSLAACSCGIQNSLATIYRGVILRTTHVTGLLTDLGHSIGMLVSGSKVARWKLGVYLLLLTGFISGALVGGVSYALLGFRSVLLVAAGYFVSGAVYYYYRVYRSAKSEPENDRLRANSP